MHGSEIRLRVLSGGSRDFVQLFPVRLEVQRTSLEILLNLLELFIQFVELLKEVLFLSECSFAISVFADPLHLLFELHMVSSEDGIFLGKLL